RVPPGIRLEDPIAPLVGDARALVRHAYLDGALMEAPVDPDRRVRRRVLHRVLDEVLQDLMEAGRIGERLQPDARHDLDAMAPEDRLERGDDLRHEPIEVD